MVNQGKKELSEKEKKTFDAIYGEIKTQIVKEDMEKERELDRKREELTRLVLQREQKTLEGQAHHAGAKVKPEL